LTKAASVAIGASRFIARRALIRRVCFFERPNMKIVNSLKSLKGRHRDNRVIRRRGRTYVINKTNRRFKARQG